jgi:hypothetical protein
MLKILISLFINLTLLITKLNCKQSFDDFYSSTSRLESLIQVACTQIVNHLNPIDHHLNNYNEIKDIYNVASLNSEKFIGNPTNAFLLIKALVEFGQNFDVSLLKSI